MKHDFSPTTLRRQIAHLSDLDLVRTRYCYQIGSTFVACALVEDSVISSMLVCDRVKVNTVLREDISNWEKLLLKQKQLQDSTLGTLISLLSKQGIAPADLSYLRWLKSKRDFFIHRFFHTGAWPGDMSERDVDSLCRTLGALEIIFLRGARRMIHILGRAGLMRLEVLSEGVLAFNPDAFEGWDTEDHADSGLR
ncbi:hypothetical protein Rleg2_6070 (plasmid) [Rhizobium leguminosarum bv. trifolii WSM2304]|uniref:Uncharacterized protein n=1 Tax=Rhizobium leguminosarum bv. trifolii (strain WSM2304) TaxID=395492 RepID=A0ABF7QYS4_RHILW|nr:hypothetical protein [Rhizobium leguminosarum]ACI59237.1 hypothetical protein Rleg2_6070 [Rhizobium leguminosarum bv. trifolii WSM2304]